MAVTYKGFLLNEPGDTAPWGPTEFQLFKDLIDYLTTLTSARVGVGATESPSGTATTVKQALEELSSGSGGTTTATTAVTDPATESVSGDKSTQQEINIEHTTAIKDMQEGQYPYADVKDPTGFVDTSITVTYNSTARTVTLSDNGAHAVKLLWRGAEVAEFVDGWESPAHDVPTGQESFFLYYNGTTAAWYSSVWDFTDAPIALVYRDGANFCLREVHGCNMSSDAHREGHNAIGTYLDPKVLGGFSNYTLDSTTATGRRPQVAEHKVWDEDIPTTLSALTTNAYSWLTLSSTSTATLSVDNTEILSIDGTSGRFNWNEFSGGSWGTSTATNNDYGKVFVMGVPVSADTECQKARYVFIPPQSIHTTLAGVQAVSPSDVQLGSVEGALQEYVFLGEIIVRATSSNWELIEVNQLTGSRLGQSSRPAQTLQNYDSVLEQGNSTSRDAVHTNGVATTTVSPTLVKVEDAINEVSFSSSAVNVDGGTDKITTQPSGITKNLGSGGGPLVVPLTIRNSVTGAGSNGDVNIEVAEGEVNIDNAVSTNTIAEREALGGKAFVAREDLTGATTFSLTGGSSVTMGTQRSYYTPSVVIISGTVVVDTEISSNSEIFSIPTAQMPNSNTYDLRMINISTGAIYSGFIEKSGNMAKAYPLAIPTGTYVYSACHGKVSV